MHLIRFIALLGLMAVATPQETTDAPNSQPGLFEPGEFETTITMPGPSGIATVWDCFAEGEGESSLEQFEMECTSIGNLTFATTKASPRNSAQQPHPMTVLEARMQRKFGVKPRQDESGLVVATTLPGSCAACSTVTVTKTAYAQNYPETCLPLATPPPPNNGILPPVPAAQVTAMSIVADLLEHQVAAEAPAQSAANFIPAILSALTANVSHPIASGAAPMLNNGVNNATVVAPTLGATASSGILSPPPSQAKSIGTSIAVGVVANVLAAAGVAYLLV